MTGITSKLKKDGVCVGYERRRLTTNGDRMQLQHRKPKGVWKTLCCGGTAWVGWIDHDEVCPFVCRDRHGKAVYEGDAVKLTVAQRFGHEVEVTAYAEYFEDGSWMFMWDCPDRGTAIPMGDESIRGVKLLDPQPGDL